MSDPISRIISSTTNAKDSAMNAKKGWRPNVTVFCGAASGTDPKFLKCAMEVGELLGRAGFDLVYGGSADGCMGAVARGCQSKGGRITGILPKVFLEWEIQNQHVDEVIWTETLAERKDLLIQKADLVLVLPGGYGTFDEFFEVITLANLKVCVRPALVFDAFGFYEGLVSWLESVVLAGFAKPQGDLFSVVRELCDLEAFLNQIKRVS
jgi:uncharacterized protein (TIGR00730 family)